MVNPIQFCDRIIAPALIQLERATDGRISNTPTARALVLGTALVESGNLTWLTQLNNGPALSFYQIEPATFNDIVYRASKFLQAVDQPGRYWTTSRLVYDLQFSTWICRLKYWLDPSPLPPFTAPALSNYHKRIYNTALGAADPVKNTPIFLDAMVIVTNLGGPR